MTNTAIQIALPENEPPSVGQILKESRLSQGLTLEEIAKTLCISKRHLVHLEEDKENLVCDVYTLGFLKSYVHYLGLDEKNLSNMFKKQASLPPQSIIPFPATFASERIPSRRILIFSFIILLAMIGGWEWSKYYDSQTHPAPEEEVVEVAPQSDGIHKDVEVTEALPELTLTPKLMEMAKALPESNAAPQDTEVAKTLSESNTVHNDMEMVKVLPESNPAPQDIELAKTPQEPNTVPNDMEITKALPESDAAPEGMKVDESPSEANTIVSAPAPRRETLSLPEGVTFINEHSTSYLQSPISPQSVRLKATEKTWVEVTNQEGRVILTRTLWPGETYELRDAHNMVLKTGNAGGISLIYSEKSIPSLGKSGEIKREIYLDPEKWVEQSPEIH